LGVQRLALSGIAQNAQRITLNYQKNSF